LALSDFSASVQLALQAELAQGALDLPPCTTLEEWHAFRAGLNQLMYTRYGVTVDDCVPVDLGDQTDYAATLQARAAAAPIAPPAAAQPAATPQPVAAAPLVNAPATADESSAATRGDASPVFTSPAAAPPDSARAIAGASPAAAADMRAVCQPAPGAAQDARALRRLFIELPALSGELRLLALPEGLPIFQQHQALLLRLGMAALNVNTMPALAWSAPDRPLPAEDQSRRCAQTLIAQSALDEAWSLLARLQLATPTQWPQLLDEADRICTNLETGLSLRRIAQPPRTEPSL
jgi:hypothetical protein